MLTHAKSPEQVRLTNQPFCDRISPRHSERSDAVGVLCARIRSLSLCHWICGRGGIGRLDGFRFRCHPVCGFESRRPHQRRRSLRTAQKRQTLVALAVSSTVLRVSSFSPPKLASAGSPFLIPTHGSKKQALIALAFSLAQRRAFFSHDPAGRFLPDRFWGWFEAPGSFGAARSGVSRQSGRTPGTGRSHTGLCYRCVWARRYSRTCLW